MSYRGRPSKGCESCRARKVKCDETKPVCNRCSKSGHDCKYRDQGDLLFRNQTAVAAQKAEDSWRKRSKSHQRAISESAVVQQPSPNTNYWPENIQYHISPSGSHDSPQSESTSEASTSIPNLNNLSLTQEIKPDLRRLAYERLLYDFVVFETPNKPSKSPDEPSDALWTFVPALYQNAKEDSCFATVVSAVSYRNFANRCNAPQAESLAAENMGKSIQLLQRMIQDKNQASSDEALGSAYLMGVYENLTTPNRDGSFLAHSGGTNALLQLRNIDEFFNNSISARMYEISFSQMLIGSLQAGKPPPIPIRNIAATKGYLPNFYSTSGIYVIQLIHNGAHLHSQWHELKRSPQPPSSRLELRDLLQSALDLDAEFQAWESTIPRSWRYKLEPNTPEARSTYDLKWRNLILGSRGSPEEIHSYPTLKRCWIWMFYRTARTFLLRDVLEILNWMFRLPEPGSPNVASENSPSPRESAADVTKAPSMNLDNVALQIHHTFTSTHLVNIIEKSCSAVLGTLTVPVYGKSFEDVMGMRGYTLLWSLGNVDSVLRAGLVPDSSAPSSPPRTIHTSPTQQLRPSPSPSSSPFSQFHNLPAPSPAMFRMPAANMHPLYHKPKSMVSQHNEFPALPLFNPSPPNVLHPDPMEITEPPPPVIVPPPPYDASYTDRHAFDSTPLHPFDRPTKLPNLDFNITKPKHMDVPARREWVNRILYYIATELGIKKAIGIPVAEGYLDVIKPEVDTILSR